MTLSPLVWRLRVASAGFRAQVNARCDDPGHLGSTRLKYRTGIDHWLHNRRALCHKALITERALQYDFLSGRHFLSVYVVNLSAL